MTYIKISKKEKNGFTLVEALFYAAGVVLLLGAIVAMLFYSYSWYLVATTVPRVDREGILLVSRIAEDLRAGESINVGQSLLEIPEGAISIDSKINYINFNKYYVLQNGRIIYKENGGEIKYLSSENMNISQLKFFRILTPVSEAMRFELGITYATKDGTKTNTYSDMVILRNSYQ